MYIQILTRYVRSSLAVVVFFIVKSESKRSPETDFAADFCEGKYSSDIRLYSCEFSNFESNRIE